MNTGTQHYYLWILILLCIPFYGISQSCHHTHDKEHHAHRVQADNSGLRFIENKGQFNDNVRFKVGLGGLNNVFIEDNTLTYLMFDEESSSGFHDAYHNKRQDIRDYKMSGHVYKMHFLNANTPEIEGRDGYDYFHNYFIGNDKAKWARHVGVYRKTYHRNIYKNIDVAYYSANGNLKYDVIVHKGGNVKDIQLQYEGVDRMYLKGGHLLVVTTVGTTRESAPYAYQWINGRKVEVVCNYLLHGNELTYEFPNGYNINYDLVIDPEVVAATLSGTKNSENFGHTATYDVKGNIYAGGVAFGSGYPTTVGAFDSTFEIGLYSDLTDMVFSKYSADGGDLIYATYVGGGAYDYPHSMIVDVNNQLCVLGTSDSENFPILDKSFQKKLGGFQDIVVLKLNEDASDLVGSTFLGGDAPDGVDLIADGGREVSLSYGEKYRGEITLDAQGNIFIASVSNSSNFPVTRDCLQPNHKGGQEGVVCKLNSDLSTLYWATYLGSTGYDSAFGIKINRTGNAIVTGTAGGADFPMISGGVRPTWMGGEECAYVAILSDTGGRMLNGTYWGTSNGKDHGYFVDIDEDRNIHVFGTTTGTGLPLTGNTYSHNHGSPQFLAAFNANLTDIIYSTTIGRGKFNTDQAYDGSFFDFVPIAFMVDKCNFIYFSGYYAEGGLPTTSGAFSNSGNSFYLGVLEPEAVALSFGTYYGNANHVDGGTSRFDKAGIVYQGVCSCQDEGRVLKTTSNAWARNQTERCDVGVFKIDFQKETVTAAIAAEPGTSGCLPYTANLSYAGQDGIEFEWYIDNKLVADTSFASYTFSEAGNYDVMLVARNRETCNIVDTSFMQIDVVDEESTRKKLSHCVSGDEPLYIDVSTSNATYNWNDGYTGATYTATETGIYWVDIKLDGCTHRDSFDVVIADPIEFSLERDTVICDILEYDIDATNNKVAKYEWSTGSKNPILKVKSDGVYAITVTSKDGCEVEDEINVLFRKTPVFNLEDQEICEGETARFKAPLLGDYEYTWSNESKENEVSLTTNGKHWLSVSNGCVHTDTFYLSVNANPIDLDTTDITCYGLCDGILKTNFDPSVNRNNVTLDWNVPYGDTLMTDLCQGIYQVTATTTTAQRTCIFVHEAKITEPDTLTLRPEHVPIRCYGENNGKIILNPKGGAMPYVYLLEQDTFLTDTLTDLAPGTYHVSVLDARGCAASKDGIYLAQPFFNEVDAGEDKEILLGDSVMLDGFVLSPTNQYTFWREADNLSCNECYQPYASPNFTTTYELVTRDTVTGCELVDSTTVRIEKNRNIFIPNVFTPNGDGKNDSFTVLGRGNIEQVNFLRIYDRWGELVFRNENFQPNIPKLGWDGHFKGELMNPDVFVYHTEIRYRDGHVERFVGDITLMY